MPSPPNIICQTCGSNKIMRVSAKTFDTCETVCPNHGINLHEWPPCILGYGDNIDIRLCLDCGQLQGNWPQELPEAE